ncbi:pfs, nacht and ankyrin domain [Trichoderma arundinaceum]|uniref:Pfs, nacht and ankyrin domain n=1 Tax=Trichoderma arundinaceum TaxID=490622 RepID=A0A395NW49_TRIAR|nr:pfs, nacht and ankyrin domain [Trichoderma arundinaceum]
MKIVQLLIEHGADVSIPGGEYGTALHAAAASRYPDEAIQVMELLLNHGAKVDQQGGSKWETALHVACYEGTIEAVQFLLDYGADVNAEGGSRFGTPLRAAAARLHWRVSDSEEAKLRIMEMLIDNGVKVNQQSGECGTALQAACLHEEDAPVHLLLDNGADVNARGGKNGTALMAACIGDNTELVRLLLDRGADVNARAEEHGTALMVACQYKDDSDLPQTTIEAVQLLLDRGADHSAVRYAATHRFGHDNADVLQLLLDQDGIDVNRVHEEYSTALHTMMNIHNDWAVEIGDNMQNWRNGVDILFKHGIAPNAMSDKLGSALHVACAIKHDDTHENIVASCWGCVDVDFKSDKTKYLLEQCPGINVNAQGGAFGSALQAAAYSG